VIELVQKIEWIKTGSFRLSRSEKSLILNLYELRNRFFILDIKDVFDVIGRFEEKADVLEITKTECNESDEVKAKKSN